MINKRLVVICSIGVAVRLAALLFFGIEQTPVTHEYGVIARHLNETGVYAFDFYGYSAAQESSYMPPFYPLFMALTMKVAGDDFFLLLRLLQVLFSTLGIVFSYAIARELWDREDIALVAAWGTALYPPFAGQVTQADTAVFDVVLLQGFVLFTLVGMRRGAPRSFFVAGVWLGWAALTRSPALVALFAVPIALIARGMRRADVLRWTGAVLLGTLLLITPWTLRNLAVHGRLVAISTNGGFNFWIGNHAGASGEFEFPGAALIESTRALSETDRDAIFYAQAFDDIRRDPSAFLELLWRKLRYFSWFRPGLGEAYAQLGDVVGPARMVTVASYAALLPLGLAGLLITRRHWRRLILVYAVIAGTALVSIFYFVATRFRAPIEVYLIVFAAYALVTLEQALRQRWSLRMIA